MDTDKAAQAKGAIDERLGAIKRLIEELESQVRAAAEATHEEAAAQPTDTTVPDPLIEVIREVGGNIALSLSGQLDRLGVMEGRLRDLERLVLQREKERVLLQQALRSTAGRQAEREPVVNKAADQPPVDYSAVVNAALQLVRELGACWMQRRAPPPARDSG